MDMEDVDFVALIEAMTKYNVKDDDVWDWPDDILMNVAAQNGWSNEKIRTIKIEMCDMGYFYLDEDELLSDPSMFTKDGAVYVPYCFWRGDPIAGAPMFEKGSTISFTPLR